MYTFIHPCYISILYPSQIKEYKKTKYIHDTQSTQQRALIKMNWDDRGLFDMKKSEYQVEIRNIVFSKVVDSLLMFLVYIKKNMSILTKVPAKTTI